MELSTSSFVERWSEMLFNTYTIYIKGYFHGAKYSWQFWHHYYFSCFQGIKGYYTYQLILA